MKTVTEQNPLNKHTVNQNDVLITDLIYSISAKSLRLSQFKEIDASLTYNSKENTFRCSLIDISARDPLVFASEVNFNESNTPVDELERINTRLESFERSIFHS